MKIYMAGYYSTNATTNDNQSTSHGRIVAAYQQYPDFLESYYYLNDKIVRHVKRKDRQIFLDSGAYSAFTLGASIDLREYCRFINKERSIIEVASNLDMIGAGYEKETYDNLKLMEGMITKNDREKRIVYPVHHLRDSDYWIEKYLGEGYDYIFLGGMAKQPTSVLRHWLDHMWGKYLTNSDGTPKVRVHGFGLTSDELMLRYPWYSVDSTAWVMASSFGYVMMDIPRLRGGPKRIRICFSDQAAPKHDIDGLHYWHLSNYDKENIRKHLLECEKRSVIVFTPQIRKMFKDDTGVELGYTPEALEKSYGLRRVLCMEYFDRIAKLAPKTFEDRQKGLFDD